MQAYYEKSGYSLKILGVTVSSRLSVADHVQNVISSCAQTLHALRLLRAHGLCDAVLQTVYRAVVAVCCQRMVWVHHGRKSAAH